MALVHAVIEATMPGVVWVDRRETPRWAIVCNLTGFWFALGDAPPRLDVADLGPVVARRPPDEPTALWAVSGRWRTVLSPLFAREATRDEFRFDGATRPVPPDLPPGFEIRPIDAAIASQFGGGTDPWVVKAWGGPEAFARRAFGVAVLRAGRLASFCAACGIGPAVAPEAEIEIGTDPEFRNRGLALCAANAFIDGCVGRGMLPAWTCSSENIASARTAARLGFRWVRTISGFPIAADPVVAAGRWAGAADEPGPQATA